MYNILFDLKKEYYFNALWPLYLQMAKDSRYHCKFRVGADHKRVFGLFLIKQKNTIEAKLREKGLEITRETAGFDAVISGDVLHDPQRFGDTLRIHLDHGVGTKTLRIRNIKKQPDYHYHVFLEGQCWMDYITSLGWQDAADFYLTGLPKLDPFFWPQHYDNTALASRLKLNPAKRTVLFAPSYKPSCIGYVQEHITDLLPDYNLLIKLHPYSWAGKYAPHAQHRFYEKLARKHPGVYLIPQDDYDIYPYLYLADTMISDTSSVVNEFLALGKHGIIYVIPQEKLKHSDGMDQLSIDPDAWLAGAFPHMHHPGELGDAVAEALHPTTEMKQKLQQYRDYFFTGLDGEASCRVKAKIDELIEGE